jgi:hypothetical protein
MLIQAGAQCGVKQLRVLNTSLDCPAGCPVQDVISAPFGSLSDVAGQPRDSVLRVRTFQIGGSRRGRQVTSGSECPETLTDGLPVNVGVPATQVAEWAGHSVDVLLKIYAKCVDGDAACDRAKIERTLSRNVAD